MPPGSITVSLEDLRKPCFYEEGCFNTAYHPGPCRFTGVNYNKVIAEENARNKEPISITGRRRRPPNAQAIPGTPAAAIEKKLS